ncbi:MAG: septum formation inhibitor Maf [Candidatus Eiseniibacteriota bacterium]|nr:MAG: septum formation inhibitor Maf [Candidatus Eisenbacteria bacterium]
MVLVSGSPRRRRLLEMIGLRFEVAVPEVDEGELLEGEPEQVVVELALRKALSVANGYPEALLIGADTVVVLEGRVLGKPEDATQAEGMLRVLSGKTHTVYTGLALVDTRTGMRWTAYERSLVRMKRLAESEIAAYVRTGEPLDKAGSYGIQGLGSIFISDVNGCFFNVMGLPVRRLYEMLVQCSRELAQRREA